MASALVTASLMARSLVSLLPSPFAAATPHDQVERDRLRAHLTRTLRAHTHTALQWALRVVLVLAGVLGLTLVAVLLYVLLYYAVIPARLHEQIIYFDYGAHAAVNNPNAEASLPTARLNLLDAEHQWQASPLINVEPTADRVLVPRLRYDVLVELELAESPTNHAIGMFMVHTTLRSTDGDFLASSARPCIVYNSHALSEAARVAFFLVPRMFRLSKASQRVQVVAVNGFAESDAHPLTQVEVRLNHPEVQVYAAKLTIVAQLTGLRYLMYHWSVATAIVVILNLVFVECVAVLGVYAFVKLPPAEDAGRASASSSSSNSEQYDSGLDDMVDVKKEKERELAPEYHVAPKHEEEDYATKIRRSSQPLQL